MSPTESVKSQRLNLANQLDKGVLMMLLINLLKLDHLSYCTSFSSVRTLCVYMLYMFLFSNSLMQLVVLRNFVEVLFGTIAVQLPELLTFVKI